MPQIAFAAQSVDSWIEPQSSNPLSPLLNFNEGLITIFSNGTHNLALSIIMFGLLVNSWRVATTDGIFNLPKLPVLNPNILNIESSLFFASVAARALLFLVCYESVM